MVLDLFQTMLSMFLFLCGASLVWVAWPGDPDWPAPAAILTLALGAVMVMAAGSILALALAAETLR